MPLVELVIDDLDHALLLDEAFVDHARHAARLREQPGLDVEQQYGIELRDGLGSPVVSAHELLAGALGGRCIEPQALGERRLHVEHEHVLAAARQQVQARAQTLQELFVATQLLEFAIGEQVARKQFRPAVAEPRGLGHPQDDLQITQPAGAFLAVRLEAVGRVLVFRVALTNFQLLAAKKCQGIEIDGEALLECLEKRPVAGDETRFEQARLHRDVSLRFAQAFVDRAYGRSDLDADVPEEPDERLHVRRERVAVGAAMQHENVDVRVRVQLAASVAAHGHERELPRHLALGPRVAHGLVDGLAQAVQEHVDLAVRGEALDELGLAFLERLTERRGGVRTCVHDGFLG